MLSEEEKKAIKMMEIIVDECKLENKRKGYEGTYYDGDTPIPYKEYETVLNLVTKLEKENEIKIKGFEGEELSCSKFTEQIGKDIIDYKFEYINNKKIIDELQKENEEKDNKVRKIISRLDNDYKRITETKTNKNTFPNYLDDYSRCRLKAYRTKTREIKEYIEQEYFQKLAKKERRISMLKIKDDVDLKELEKFGFISKCGVIYKPKKGERDVIQIEVDPETRILSYPGFSDLFHTREDTTFDLIQAGLVEKVENE